MADHLPECPQARRYGMPCICPELRACERRMMHKEYILDDGDPFKEVFRAGYKSGLDDARKAVFILPHDVHPTHGYQAVSRGNALAAIDSLCEPPPLPPTTGIPERHV